MPVDLSLKELEKYHADLLKTNPHAGGIGLGGMEFHDCRACHLPANNTWEHLIRWAPESSRGH